MLFFKQAVTKTVKSVYATFTAELEEVSKQHQAIADEAAKEQEALEARMAIETSRKDNAESEVAQAANAMRNIGELLGVKAE